MDTVPHYHFDRLVSTNDEAARRLRAGEQPPFWVTTADQTGGRGRQGRSWQSVSGNLYASLAWMSARPLKERPAISYIAGIAVCETIAALTPGDCHIKWPNDVLIDGAKVAGLLLESDAAGLVIGIGINVAAAPASGLQYPATSLDNVVTAEEVRVRLDANLRARIMQFERDGFAGQRADWIARAAHLGSRISVRNGGDQLEGCFEDLDNDGALVLRLDSGAIRRILAGDVFPV